MRTEILSNDEAMDLVAKVDDKYRPAWQGRPADEQVAMALYFLPHRSRKPTLVPTRPRVIKWYCPFASQCEFPTGHRYCINVYTGCDHHPCRLGLLPLEDDEVVR